MQLNAINNYKRTNFGLKLKINKTAKELLKQAGFDEHNISLVRKFAQQLGASNDEVILTVAQKANKDGTPKTFLQLLYDYDYSIEPLRKYMGHKMYCKALSSANEEPLINLVKSISVLRTKSK